jgi:signal transduction histidine kinase
LPDQLANRQRLDEEVLWHSASEVRVMSMVLMSMQEMERKRIASDLHDSIGQLLSALSCGIGAALDSARKRNSELTSAKLEKLACQVKATIVEVQRIAMNLRPAMLDDIGLVATLAWFVREFSLTHPRLVLKADIDIDESDVLPALRTPIFRVVQEAANNVVKHSGASEMRLRLQRADSEVQLEVSDNGIGFTATNGGNAAPPSAGMGLRGMRERAQCSGGRFRLLSSPGKGTKLFVAWPVPK